MVYNGTFVVALYFLFRLLCTFAVLCDAIYLFIKASLLHQSFLVLNIDWIRISKIHVRKMTYQNHLLSLLKNWSAALRNDAEDDLNTKPKCLMMEMVCVCVVKVSIKLDGKTWHCLMLWEKKGGPHEENSLWIIQDVVFF